MAKVDHPILARNNSVRKLHVENNQHYVSYVWHNRLMFDVISITITSGCLVAIYRAQEHSNKSVYHKAHVLFYCSMFPGSISIVASSLS